MITAPNGGNVPMIGGERGRSGSGVRFAPYVHG
jgi:hypothetical protein